MNCDVREIGLMVKRVLLFSVTLAMAVGSASTVPLVPMGDQAKVYYFPLFVNKTSPLTEQTIEKCYDLSSVASNAVPNILNLLALDELPPYEGRTRNVRLKIVRAGKPPVTLDFGGNVFGLGKLHRLSTGTQRKIRSLLFAELPFDAVDERIKPAP